MQFHIDIILKIEGSDEIFALQRNQKCDENISHFSSIPVEQEISIASLGLNKLKLI